MKKNLFTILAFLMLGVLSNISAQNLVKQCTPSSVYYNCGAQAAHQSEQGPWFDFVINGNQNSWYQGYGVESASWKEFDNSTAQLTARLYQIINKVNVKFDMNLTFSNKGSSTPHGGGDGWHCLPSNTNDWYYYRAASGSISGVAGTQVQGVTFSAALVGGTALQVGTGGSTNSTSKYGMSAWLSLTQTGGWNICWNKGSTDLYFDLNNCTTPNVCNNLTSGGQIGSNQSGCSPFAVSAINNITLPSGGDASKAIEYVWLKTTDVNGISNLPTCDANGIVNLKSWTEIAGAKSASYSPGTVNQTTWYLRCARRAGCVCYYGESNIVKITITGPCPTCNNFTSGGQIGSHQSGCSPFNPSSINNITLPSGGSGNTEYVWLKSTTASTYTTSNANQWQVIAGATAQNYDPSDLTQTTWFIRCARRSGCTDFTGESNIIKITITGPCQTCSNLTSGGQIGSHQSGCSPFAASAINNITLPSGGDASKAIEYVWLKTTDANGTSNLPTCDANGVVNLKSWTEIAGANAASYSPGTVNQTTWYLRCARRAGCVCYYGESNIVKITVTGPCQTCNNFTSGGQIGNNQSGCSPFNSSSINNITLPSGGSGNTEYVWLKSTTASTYTTSNANQWQVISGATTQNYDPSDLTQTTWFIRCARRSGCTDFTGESNIIKITITGPCQTCSNLTSGGQIGSNQSGCSPFNPSSINNITLPSGGDASKTIEYVWLKTTDVNGVTNLPTCDANGVVNLKSWTEIAGANSASYSPGTVNQTTWYLRCARRAGCVCYYGESNIVKITITGNCGICPNLVTNGSFSAGFTGFQTDIPQKGGPDCSNGGAAAVRPNPNHWGFSANCADQDGNGAQLLIDFPAGDIWQKIWAQTVNVQQNTTYTFTFWAQSIYPSNPGQLFAMINTQAYPVKTLPTTTCQWVKYEVQWNSGTNTTATLLIKNTNAECSGNDFGIDNISFSCNGGTPGTCNVTVSATNNGPKCTGQNVQLSANGVSTSTGGGNNGTSYGNNLVVNGDFQNGNTGFTSELTYKAWDGGCDNYSVTSTPKNDWKWPADCQDHTGGTGGKMAIFDSPGGDAWKVYWKQCIAVEPNTTYEFSYWAMSLYSGNPAKLYAVINNMNAGNVTPQTLLSTTTCQWQKITFTWNSGSATSACIMIKNDNGDCNGNDFAIDDVSLRKVITTPSQTCTPSYSWSGPNNFTSNQQNPSVSAAGDYTVIFKDQYCCTATATTTVVINPNPVANITGNLSVCTGGTTTLTATGGGRYAWSNGSSSPSITVGAGTYSVTVTNGFCTASATATVQNTANPVANITGNLSVCNNGTTTLTATGGGTYAWSNGATSPSITVGAGTYSVIVKNVAGCTDSKTVTVTNSLFTTKITGNLSVCTGETTTLTASGGGTYAWSNGSTSPSITVGAGTYNVTVTNGVCSASATATVQNAANPVANITGNLSVCNNGTTTLTATGGGTYAWSNGATSPSITVGAGTYSVVVKNAAGCTDSKTVTVKNSNVSAKISGNTTICTGTTTTLTASGGVSYKWNNGSTSASITVGAGLYSVTVTNAAGCTDVASKTVVANNCNNASIGDFVWCDKNANGVQDLNEPGILGVTVTLTGTNASGESINLTTVTSSNGSYLFSNLQAGTYKVTFTKPVGYELTGQDKGGDDAKDSDINASGMTPVFMLANGQSNLTIDAGYYQLGSIGDFVFEDLNNNGTQDTNESGIANVTVTLNGIVNGVPLTRVTTTNSNGKYLFANLVPGTYSVTFLKPTGYTASPVNQGGDDTKDSDANPITGVSPTITLTSGENNLTIDAGFNKIILTTTVGDFVWLDCNKNGIQDGGELGLAGVTVILKNTVTNATQTTTTNNNGFYNFANVASGTYTVTFVTVKNLAFATKDLGGNDAKDSDANPNGITDVFTVNGVAINTIDAGLQDITKPTFTSSVPDVTVECDAVPAKALPLATDNCDLNVTVVYNENRINGACADSYTLIRTWTASDDCGNNCTITQKVTVRDTKAPVLNGVPNDVTIGCGIVTPPPATPTATDNCDTQVTITFAEALSQGTGNCLTVLRLRNWIATDNCGNTSSKTQLITSTDNEGPIIVGVPADITVQCNAVPTVPTDITASDNCSPGAITVVFTTSTSAGQAGVYIMKRTWSATDACGNKSVKTQVICIKDTQAPTFTGVPQDLTVECNAIPPATNPVAKDNCDNKMPVTLTETRIAGNCVNNFIIKRTWSVTDDAGNKASATQTITVQDTKAPIITGVPADVTVVCGDPIPLPPATITATDNCDTYVPITFSEIYYDGLCDGKSRILCQWVAKDACGNVAIKQWSITIVGVDGSSRIAAPNVRGNETQTTFRTSDINVFPNPTRGDVNIQFNNSKVSKITVFDITGRMIQSIEQDFQGDVQLKLNEQGKGVYTIQLHTENGVITKKVLLID